MSISAILAIGPGAFVFWLELNDTDRDQVPNRANLKS